MPKSKWTRWTMRCGWCAAGWMILGCEPAPSPAPPPPQTPVATQQAQKAVAGVGKRGQSLQDNTGVSKIISGPASALMNVEQRMVFEVQIPQALQLYKASEGKLPQSHTEFMTKIIEPNRIQLPELPAGAVYHFNTEKGELWVYPEDQAPSE